MSLQSLECLLCHVWHLNILLTRLVARFDPQINNIPRGSEDTVYGNGPFLKSRTAPISCKVCLSIIRWYKGA